jgi:hypothetical protein
LVVYLLEILLFGEKIGYFSSIEDVVDIFKERLIGYLDVSEDKRKRLPLSSSKFCYLLKISPKRFRIIVLHKIDLVLFTLHDERGKFGQTLFS